MKEAQSYLDIAVKTDPKDKQIYEYRAKVYKDLGVYEKALKEHYKIVELFPDTDYDHYLHREIEILKGKIK